MTSLNIENTDTGAAGVTVEVWERGVGGQADTLIGVHTLAGGESAEGLAVGATCYLVVREGNASDAKTIDNWSQAPAVPDGA
jgi:hypothetical protein